MLVRSICGALVLMLLATPAWAADPALIAIQASRPREFAEPADFQAYTTKLADWLVAVNKVLDTPRKLVELHKAELADRVLAWGGDVVATKARVDDVLAAHRGPIATATSEVSRRREQLLQAMVPARADALRAATSAVVAAQSAISHITTAGGYASGLSTKNVDNNKSGLDSALYQAKSAASEAYDQALRAQRAIAEDGSPGLVESATRDLATALFSLDGHERRRDAALVQPIAALERAQKALDAKAASWRTRLDQAEADLAKLQEPFIAGSQELASLGSTIGTLQDLNWKLFKGFDAHAYWETQRRRIP